MWIAIALLWTLMVVWFTVLSSSSSSTTKGGEATADSATDPPTTTTTTTTSWSVRKNAADEDDNDKACAWEWSTWGPCESRSDADACETTRGVRTRERRFVCEDDHHGGGGEESAVTTTIEERACTKSEGEEAWFQTPKRLGDDTDTSCVGTCDAGTRRWVGVRCDGTLWQSDEPCSLPPCHQDCRLTEWWEKTPCADTTCGSRGTRTLAREVIAQAVGDGAPCDGFALLTEAPCPDHPETCAPCVYVPVGACKGECGPNGGTQRFEIDRHASAPDCVASSERLSAACDTGVACDQDCEMGPWVRTGGSLCVATNGRGCGPGTYTATRAIVREGRGTGTQCASLSTETEMPCDTGVECSQDCVLSPWSAIPSSACSKACRKTENGTVEPAGYHTRTRAVLEEPYGPLGAACGALETREPCLEDRFCPVDCQLEPWATVGPCDTRDAQNRPIRCGANGTQAWVRQVRSEAMYGGRPCSEYAVSEFRACTREPCADRITWTRHAQKAPPRDAAYVHAYTGEEETTAREAIGVPGPGGQDPDRVTDVERAKRLCQLTPGCVFVEVSEPSGPVYLRGRSVGGQGKVVSELTTTTYQKAVAQVPESEVEVEGCVLTEDWSAWTPCDKACDGGRTHRLRVPDRVPSSHARGAEYHATTTCAPLRETAACHVHPCPVDCVVSDWGPFEACSESCETKRTRTVVRAPNVSGRPCGPLEETFTCDGGACPKRRLLYYTTENGRRAVRGTFLHPETGALYDDDGARAVLDRKVWETHAQFTERAQRACTAREDCVAVNVHRTQPFATLKRTLGEVVTSSDHDLYHKRVAFSDDLSLARAEITVPCVQSEWSAWSACDDTCFTTRTRETLQAPSGANAAAGACGPSTETAPCRGGACPVPENVVDLFDKHDGRNLPESTRFVDASGQVVTDGASAAHYGAIEDVLEKCARDARCTAVTEHGQYGFKHMRASDGSGVAPPMSASRTHRTYLKRGDAPTPQDCVVRESDWSAWSACEATCTQTRTRPVYTPPFGGKACDATHETRACVGGDVCRRTPKSAHDYFDLRHDTTFDRTNGGVTTTDETAAETSRDDVGGWDAEKALWACLVNPECVGVDAKNVVWSFRTTTAASDDPTPVAERGQSVYVKKAHADAPGNNLWIQLRELETSTCAYSAPTPWSACDAQDGCRSRRTIAPLGGDGGSARCATAVTHTRACPSDQACETNPCVYDAWSTWSPCASVTCTRRRTRRDRTSQTKCETGTTEFEACTTDCVPTTRFVESSATTTTTTDSTTTDSTRTYEDPAAINQRFTEKITCAYLRNVVLRSTTRGTWEIRNENDDGLTWQTLWTEYVSAEVREAMRAAYGGASAPDTVTSVQTYEENGRTRTRVVDDPWRGSDMLLRGLIRTHQVDCPAVATDGDVFSPDVVREFATVIPTPVASIFAMSPRPRNPSATKTETISIGQLKWLAFQKSPPDTGPLTRLATEEFRVGPPDRIGGYDDTVDYHANTRNFNARLPNAPAGLLDTDLANSDDNFVYFCRLRRALYRDGGVYLHANAELCGRHPPDVSTRIPRTTTGTSDDDFTSLVVVVSDSTASAGSSAAVTAPREEVTCAEWGEWGECSTLCGYGNQRRVRPSTSTCAGSAETRPCQVAPAEKCADPNVNYRVLWQVTDASGFFGGGANQQSYTFVTDRYGLGIGARPGYTGDLWYYELDWSGLVHPEGNPFAEYTSNPKARKYTFRHSRALRARDRSDGMYATHVPRFWGLREWDVWMPARPFAMYLSPDGWTRGGHLMDWKRLYRFQDTVDAIELMRTMCTSFQVTTDANGLDKTVRCTFHPEWAEYAYL